VGCTLAGSLTIMIKDILRTVNPDYLFVEPFELVVTAEILTALRMGTRDVDYEIGPVFALVDGPDFDFSWRERRQTIMNHINRSKRVFITRADLVEEKRLEEIRDILKAEAKLEDALFISVPDNRGIEAVMAEIS
jgi:G3E family GTPase